MVALLKTSPPMAICRDVDPSPPSSGAERRMFPRKELHARVEGKRIDHSLPALRAAAPEAGPPRPVRRRAVRDQPDAADDAASGWRCPSPPSPQPGGSTRGWDAVGRVIRCEPAAWATASPSSSTPCRRPPDTHARQRIIS